MNRVELSSVSPAVDDCLPVELLRDTFNKCINELIEKTEFGAMYDELCNTEIGKIRMFHVFVLRATSPDKARDEQFSHELYDGIFKEHDEHFSLWFKAIRVALSKTGNKNNGKHEEVAEAISNELLKKKMYDRTESENTFKLQLSCKGITTKPVSSVKIKILLIGCRGSGKTRFFRLVTENPVPRNMSTISTIGPDFKVQHYAYDNEVIEVNLTDTAGQERFQAITKSFFRGANGALLFVDLKRFTNPEERDDITKQTIQWMKDTENILGKKIPVLLVGAMYDSVTRLTNEEGRAFEELAKVCADGHWIYTSSMTDLNVERAVYIMIELVMNCIPREARVEFTVDEPAIKVEVGSQPMGQPSDRGQNQSKKKCARC